MVNGNKLTIKERAAILVEAEKIRTKARKKGIRKIKRARIPLRLRKLRQIQRIERGEVPAGKLRELLQQTRAAPPKVITGRPLTALERVERLKIFGKRPKPLAAISRQTSREVFNSLENFDFLDEETFMFSDDFFGVEQFVPKRLSDL